MEKKVLGALQKRALLKSARPKARVFSPKARTNYRPNAHTDMLLEKEEKTADLVVYVGCFENF